MFACPEKVLCDVRADGASGADDGDVFDAIVEDGGLVIGVLSHCADAGISLKLGSFSS